MKELINRSTYTPDECATAVRVMSDLVYGRGHWALMPSQRLHRATLAKLANTLDQLALVDDLDLYQLSFACPEQLKRYDKSLRPPCPSHSKWALRRTPYARWKRYTNVPGR
ncbi:MAG: hypothetical protein JNJ91_02990 [Flavobacteriales bacterium]|nr:hypothetical protein [Flavobacteriales bacterium]